MLELLPLKDVGPIPFRISPLWIQNPGFMERVKAVWDRAVNGSPFFVSEEKLRRLKSELKCWAKTLPNPTSERKYAQASLEAHHLQMEDAVITEEVLTKEPVLQQKFHRACLEEEEFIVKAKIS